MDGPYLKISKYFVSRPSEDECFKNLEERLFGMQCGSYQGLAILQCKNLNYPYYYGVLQCKKREGVEEEMY